MGRKKGGKDGRDQEVLPSREKGGKGPGAAATEKKKPRGPACNYRKSGSHAWSVSQQEGSVVLEGGRQESTPCKKRTDEKKGITCAPMPQWKRRASTSSELDLRGREVLKKRRQKGETGPHQRAGTKEERVWYSIQKRSCIRRGR